MTALVASRPDMPGYNSYEADDVQTPSSDFSFYQAAMPTSSGLFPFSSQTGPSSNTLGASSWDTTGEGSQNFQPDFLDNGSSHLGDAEDFTFNLDGSLTPRGQSAADELQGKWNMMPATPVALPIGGEPMKRERSRTSTGSHKHRITKPASKAKMASVSSQVSSRLSNMDITGNATVFSGSQTSMDVNQCLFLDNGPSGVSSHMLFPDMPLDMTMGPDGLPSPPTEMIMHVVPSHIPLDPETGLACHSPSASWASLSTPESHLSSPAASPAGTWLPDPLMASPPRSDNASPILTGHGRPDGKYPGQDLMVNDLSGTMMAMVGDEFGAGLPAPFSATRRSSNEGESARDHPLYKDAKPGQDGLFHCPWEGQANCNHKPEKLKCNYDKFVDSHLKPYRCKDASCENARFSSTACLLRHEREAHAMHGHGDKPFLCSYDGCDRSMPGNGFPRQWNLRDHMRRVHNDNRLPGSPTGTAQGQQPSKGRKRKDAPKAAPAPSRKTSAKAGVVEAASRETQSQRPLIEEWTSHHKALEAIVRELSLPQNPRSLQLIQSAQDHLSTMSTLNAGMVGDMQTSLRRAYSSSG